MNMNVKNLFDRAAKAKLEAQKAKTQHTGILIVDF